MKDIPGPAFHGEHQRGPELARLEPPPDASSRGRAWDGVVVDLHKWRGAGRVTSPAPDHDIIAMRVSGVTPLMQRRDGKTHHSIATAGNVTVHPRGIDSNWAWEHPGAVVLVRLPLELLADAAADGPRPARGEIPNCFGVRDPFVERIAMTLADEVDQTPHPTQLLVSQTLSAALAHHMVHRFCRARVPAAPRPSGLAGPRLSLVLAYIEEHLDEPITLDALAALAHVSRFHFARLFRASTGTSPMAFVEQSRLRRAQALIRAGEHTLTEISALLGFADQSHFTRRFRRQFGCTPSAFVREQRGRRTLALPPAPEERRP